MVHLLDESRMHNTVRISNRGFNQLFSSSCYIHGIRDNNNIFIDIITDKDINSEVYLVASYFSPRNVHITQIILLRSIDN